MESAIRRIKMNDLRGILELCRITCAALEKQFNEPDLPSQKRLDLYLRWDEIVKDRNAAQSELAALELAERVGCGDPDVLTP